MIKPGIAYIGLEGWHVERVANSGARRNSVCGLVGIKDGAPYLIEVKITWKEKFKPPKKQIGRLVEVCQRCKAIPMLAVLYKRKGWKIENLNYEKFYLKGFEKEVKF